jgi:hypothetical protein
VTPTSVPMPAAATMAAAAAARRCGLSMTFESAPEGPTVDVFVRRA